MRGGAERLKMQAQSQFGGAARRFKITQIGDSDVGKSCLLLRFTEGRFNEAYLTTLGVDYKNKTVKSEDGMVPEEVRRLSRRFLIFKSCPAVC